MSENIKPVLPGNECVGLQLHDLRCVSSTYTKQ